MLLPATYPPYLFRGQSKRHVPCFPSMYRHIKTMPQYMWKVSEADAMRIVADAARTLWYYSELERHPIFQWAKANRLYLPELELAQHYGIPTALLDLSESIEVALFFATHEFKDGMFHPCTSGTGILYMVDRTRVPKGLVSRFISVASQPFLRPLSQWAWTCELLMGECFEDCPSLGAIEFEHYVAGFLWFLFLCVSVLCLAASSIAWDKP
ncbi:FRG domain-containing protein [Dyella jejuensis]|uniref:FRG domain-containing protein n=1 Tax=Dyella jejuensis TaxID=1432009 RepID=UPI0038511A75